MSNHSTHSTNSLSVCFPFLKRFSYHTLRKHALIGIGNTAVLSLIGLSTLTLYANKAMAYQNSSVGSGHQIQIQAPLDSGNASASSSDTSQKSVQQQGTVKTAASKTRISKIGIIDESHLYLSHPESQEMLVDTDEDQPVLLKEPVADKPTILVPPSAAYAKANYATEDEEYRIPKLNLSRTANLPSGNGFFRKIKHFTDVREKVDTLSKLVMSIPLKIATLSSHFGLRNGRPHQGIDLAADYGSPIYAAAPGKVIYAGWEPGYGNTIIVDHGHGLKTRYAHCSTLEVSVGAHVERRQEIALVGSTGHSTGPHLHFEVIANEIHRDPELYLPRL